MFLSTVHALQRSESEVPSGDAEGQAASLPAPTCK